MRWVREYQRLRDERLKAAPLNIDKVGWKTMGKSREGEMRVDGLVSTYTHPGNYNHMPAERSMEWK